MNRLEISDFVPANPDVQNQLNRIVTNLLFVGKDKKSFAVTSCHEGEGKSTLAVQLGCTLARKGYKVIIIDAVPDDSSVFRYEKPENEKEKNDFSDYLNGKCNLSDLYYITDVYNLFVFPLMHYISDCSTPANPGLFSNLLKLLSDSCDFVLVDTPAAGQTIDAVTTADACDGIVLVVKYKSTKKKDIREVVSQLEKTGTPILGCVINKVKFDSILSRKRYRFLRTSHFGKNRKKK